MMKSRHRQNFVERLLSVSSEYLNQCFNEPETLKLPFPWHLRNKAREALVVHRIESLVKRKKRGKLIFITMK